MPASAVARRSLAPAAARRSLGPAAARRSLALALALLAAAGCGDDDDDAVSTPPEGEPVVVSFECPEVPAAAGEHVVMVIDHGFDLSLPALAGKVVGCYQRVCDGPDPDGGPLPDDPAEAKRAYLERLGRKDVSCRLAPGASLRKSSSFERIAPQKEAWNAELARKRLTQDFPGFRDIARVIGGEESYSYHGTWVASVLAYQNPNAKFVVVNNESIRRSDVAPSCPPAAEFDRELALLRDPDVRAAYVAAPYEQVAEEFDAIVRRHRVTLVNESFGQEHWQTMNEVCPGLDWQGYYAVAAELGAARAEALTATGVLDDMSVLSVVSAGNDALPIESPSDAFRCGGDVVPDGFGPESATVLVGSYDPATGARSSFSDHGPCVEAYAPGEAIVVAGPEGWLFAVSGTSFAAPLATRSLALTQPAVAGGRALRDALLATRGAEGALPLTSFPPALLYRDKTVDVGPSVATALAARAGGAVPRGAPFVAPLRPSLRPLSGRIGLPRR